MIFKKLLLHIGFVLSAHLAWASSDNYCQPDWSLYHGSYDRCSNLPVLSPGNDTRVNLKLLLVDSGLAVVKAGPPFGKVEAESGYGKVPFSLDTSEFIFNSPPSASEDNSDNVSTSSSYGEGTRCVSNEGGKADFIEAVKQSRDLSAAERQLLIKARKELIPGCIDVNNSSDAGPDDSINTETEEHDSTAFQQFERYLNAASAFYEGSYAEAGADFRLLTNSDQPWLKETSLYMLGRTDLNLSQQNAFDPYGFPDLDKVDQKAVQSAEVKFNCYLKEYPAGLYAASARGLLRRVYWMSKQPQKLADEFAWQLNHPDSPQYYLPINDFAREADNKLLATIDPAQIKNPLLLATIDLSLMRKTDSDNTKQISFADLQKQEPLFAGHKALFEYLLAAHRFYVQKDAAATLKNLPDTIPQKMTYLDFSRLILRGQALEATKNHHDARRLWQALLPVSKQPLQNETVQLALALNYEYSREPGLVFKKDSPITEPTIRYILLRNNASADLLRQVIKSRSSSSREHHVAIYTLLYKDLLLGHYQDFVKDYRFLPADAAKYKPAEGMNPDEKSMLSLFTWSGQKSEDSYSCPSILNIAKVLANSPKDPLGLICLGDFANTNGLDSGYSWARTSMSSSGMLGSSPSHFPGNPFSRGEAYKTVIADTKSSSDLKAYALFRSIQCYATMGSNHCGGDDVEQSVRKSWFKTLKSRYANTAWSKLLKYYW